MENSCADSTRANTKVWTSPLMTAAVAVDAQQEIANGQQTGEQSHRVPQGVLAPGCRGLRGHGQRS